MTGERPAVNTLRKGNPRGSGYDRAANDFYVEPEAAVWALLNAEKFFGRTHDPACGSGTIPTVFRKAGLACTGSDLVDRGFTDGAHGVDFLTAPQAKVDNIVSNPPYNLAEEFALRALSRANHKVAFLVRFAWLEGIGRRRRLFQPHPPSRVLVFSNRISCPPGLSDVKPKNGAVAYAWVIWNSDFRGPTEFDFVLA